MTEESEFRTAVDILKDIAVANSKLMKLMDELFRMFTKRSKK